MLFKTILVPVDGSKMSFKTAEVALSLAREVSGLVRLLYVVNSKYLQKILDLGMQDKTLAELASQFRRTGEKALNYLENLAKEKYAPASVQKLIVEGDPADEIIHEARKGDYDLIVMAVKDRDHTTPYLLGHVTERVIESGILPVLTVPLTFELES
ncbi:MAG: universal stress protein [Promethearchaeota archaeon]